MQKVAENKIKENSANSFPSTQAVFHCLSEIHAKVTIFQAGSKVYWSKVRTFCMFYSVFRHITHKSLPLLLGEQQTEFCFQQIFETCQKTRQGQCWPNVFVLRFFLKALSSSGPPNLPELLMWICTYTSTANCFLFTNCLFRTNLLVWNTWVLKYFWIILPHIPKTRDSANIVINPRL